jgi:RimJ/RimL family protein N-acetyltransferase
MCDTREKRVTPITDLLTFLDSRWASYLGCSERQLRDGERHLVARPRRASDEGSPWPLRRGPISVFTTGPGWAMSVPENLLDLARSVSAAHTFGEFVADGDRLQQAWFDQMQATGSRSPHRGDRGYALMNRLAGSLQVRGWSHYLLSYCDPTSWAPKLDEHVQPITEDQPGLWQQWQRWPGPMVGPAISRQFEIADVFGYVLQGKLVSAAQLEAGPKDFAWEYGVDTLPEFRARGFATAVLNTVTAFIIERGRVPWHYCDHYNKASGRLPGKLGYFRYAEGLFALA